MAKTPPSDRHITYQHQYRKCGKVKKGWRCRTCSEGPGHGPYWYAYWRDATTNKLRSAYVGKERPAA